LKFYDFLKKLSFSHSKGDDNLEEFQHKIYYQFKDKKLMLACLTHSSYKNKGDGSAFERLEFLGDSVLGLVVADMLFKQYPMNQEGKLSEKKSKLVSRKMLSLKGKELDLGSYLYLGERSFDRNGEISPTIIGNAVESVIAAIYLDGGIDEASKFIIHFILKDFEHMLTDTILENYKSILQEYVQAKSNKLPIYKMVSQTGPEHKKIFTVSVSIDGEEQARAEGESKKKAQQAAAKKVCESLNITK